MKETDWIDTFKDAYNSQNLSLNNDILLLLDSKFENSKNENYKKLINDVYKIYLKYFFMKARKGELFGDIKKFDNLIGHSIEINYGLFEGPFINLARTYWTFKLELYDIFHEDNKTYKQILNSIEFDLGSVFFPTPGPIKQSYKITRYLQKEFLEKYAHGINVDKFLSESPILKIIKRRPSCLFKLIILIIFILIILYLIFNI